VPGEDVKMFTRSSLTSKAFGAGVVMAAMLHPVMSYELVADCVPGSIVQSLNETEGRIGFYTKALQQIMNSTVGDLKLLAEGDNSACIEAMNAINTESVMKQDVTTQFKMTQLGLKSAMQEASEEKSYLYVFFVKGFTPMKYITDCVPGGVAGTLNQTMGKIGFYTKALQTILPNLLGDLRYLGVSDSAGPCMEAQNRINTGNATSLHLLRKHMRDDVAEVDLFKGLAKADGNKTYMYVFENKMWNKTKSWWI
jgi:hypothetical protein